MDDQRNDDIGLDDDTLLSLWDTAEAIAGQRCQRSLARLRRGDGGFYDQDDLRQDLFLEFLALVRRTAGAENQADDGDGEGALWDHWQRILWGQGQRLLRRVPQRLWSGAIDGPAEPLNNAEGEEDVVDPIDRYATGAPSPEEAQCIAGEMDRLERALWRLSPCQRQVLYMVTIADLRPADVAAQLRLSTNAVHRRTHRARRTLRLAMAIAGETIEEG